jgi:hypothetical protein
MNHREIEELLGAYAIDAVDPAEHEEIELHLRDCPRCRAEIADHREVAALLSHTGAPAPDGLWDRIASALDDAPPPLELARVPSPAPGTRRNPVRSMRWVAAVAAVAAVITCAVGVAALIDNRHMRRADPTSQALARALADPMARIASMRSPDGKLRTDAVIRADGTGFVYHSNLPGLPAGRTYQLWALVGTDSISAGVLGRDPGLRPFTVDGDAHGFAISEEHAGGATQPSATPLVAGELSS